MKPAITTASQLLLNFDKQLIKLLKRELNAFKSLSASRRRAGKLAA